MLDRALLLFIKGKMNKNPQITDATLKKNSPFFLGSFVTNRLNEK